MTIQEYSACLNKILTRNLFLRKEINALSIIGIQYIVEKIPLEKSVNTHLIFQIYGRITR